MARKGWRREEGKDIEEKDGEERMAMEEGKDGEGRKERTARKGY